MFKTIHQLLQNTAFSPEDAGRLGEAYETTLLQLNLAAARNDPLTETVAKVILEIAQTGEKDPERIRDLALARMKGD